MIDYSFLTKQFSYARRAFWSLAVLLFVAVFGAWLAAESSPHRLLPPLIPYASTTQNLDAAFASPLSLSVENNNYRRHWLGTDGLGRDVAAGIIQGTRTALVVGFGGMIVALFIGLPLGLMAGFFGDDRLEASISGLILRGMGVGLWLYFAFVLLHLDNSVGAFLGELMFIAVCFSLIINMLQWFLKKIFFLKFLNRRIVVPLDSSIMRLVEIMQAVPIFLWLLAALAVVGSQKLTVGSLALLIGLTSWTTFTRLVRGEMWRIRSLEFMEAAATTGASSARQMLRHALPNVVSPALVAFAFGVGSGVLFEALLSFVGLGLPAETVTWGTLLGEARTDFSRWWLVVFPGLAIFITVYTCNRLGETIGNRQIRQ